MSDLVGNCWFSHANALMFLTNLGIISVPSVPLIVKTVKELWTIRTFAYSDIIRTIALVSDDLGQVGCTDFTTTRLIKCTRQYDQLSLLTSFYGHISVALNKIQNKIRLHYKIDRIHLIWNAICLSSFRYI